MTPPDDSGRRAPERLLPGAGAHPPGRAAAAALVLALLGFALLSLLVTLGVTEAFDRWAVTALRTPGAPGVTPGPDWLGEFFFDVTHAGGRSILGLFGLLAAGWLALLRLWRELALLASALLGGIELGGAFKALFDRVRPDHVTHLAQETSASFPSGHATHAAIAYVTFAILLGRLAPHAGARAYLAAAAAFVVLLVGFSRVWLGVHYPSDVLAGWCLGTACALACWLLVDRLSRR